MRTIIVLLALAITGSLIALAQTAVQPANAQRVQAAVSPATSKFTLTGVSSCTAQACHGALAPKAGGVIWGNEYAIWQELDPHAEAYSDLFQDRSKRMAENLGLKEGAHRSQRCLVCHSVGVPDSSATFAASDSVSCEACHGPASGWFEAHTNATWKNRTASFKHTNHGLNHLKSLSARAKKCAECHVGTGDRNGDSSPDRDMNHDLIAAGHPRLNFEFGAYLANYPKHWTERTWDANGRVAKAAPPADFEVRAWAIGQVAVAQASLELLAARASAAEADKTHAVWPELAEYSCFDCHHGLQAESWRQSRYSQLKAEDPDRPLGQPDWGSWHFPMLPLLAKSPLAESTGALEPLASLRPKMIRMGAEPGLIAGEAKAAATALETWLANLEAADYEPAAISELLKTLTEDGRTVALNNWDAAAQLYLALVALQQARGEDPAVAQSLGTIAEALRYVPRQPNGSDIELDSPASFDPQESFSRGLDAVRESLKKGS